MAIQVCETLQLSNSSDIIGSDGCSFLYKNLTDLRDVNTTGIADGNTLVWNIATSTWVPGTSSGSISASDINVASIINLTATNVQSALTEQQSDIDNINTQLAGIGMALQNINS